VRFPAFLANLDNFCADQVVHFSEKPSERPIPQNTSAPGAFSGEFESRANIGKSADDLVAIWDTEHPDDPVV